VRTTDGPPPGTAFCFGDGSGAACPCGNTGGPGEGCANSTGAGATLVAHGTTSVAANDLWFTSAQAPANSASLLYQGDSMILSGNGVPFMDGLRCAGSNVRRLQIQHANASGTTLFGPGLAGTGGWVAGQTKRFQVWYRNPAGPCGAAANLTNGYEVLLAP
jgi:hypothetical protein